MSWFIRKSLFFTILSLFVVSAKAGDYLICVKFATGAGQPVRIKTVDTYCIDSVPSVTNVDKSTGEAEFTILTEGGIFEPCGYEHSSATFSAVDSDNKEKLKFEFYKPWGGVAAEPHIDILTPHAHCTVYHGPITIICSALAKNKASVVSVPNDLHVPVKVGIRNANGNSDCIY